MSEPSMSQNAEDYWKARAEAAEAELREAQIEIEAARAFGGGIYGENVKPGLNNWYRQEAVKIVDSKYRPSHTPAEASGWQDIAIPPKNGRPVLVFYKNVLGNGRIIKAMYAKRFTIEQSPDCELGEYNEDQECYYLPEGWYECVDNCDEYTWIALEDCNVPTHWRHLPVSPTGEK